ncbi:MAG: hypothetical protein U1E52_00295 [Geminicoccaceae bacterium]
MAEQFSLDLLGQHILAVRGDLATIKADVAAIKEGLDHRLDELSVVSSLAMRATGERDAWASIQAQLRKLTARVEAVEHRVAPRRSRSAAPAPRLPRGRPT